MLVLIKFFEDKRLDHYSDSKTLQCSNLGKISTWQSVTPWSCVRNAQAHKYHPNLATSHIWPLTACDQEAKILFSVAHLEKSEVWAGCITDFHVGCQTDNPCVQTGMPGWLPVCCISAVSLCPELTVPSYRPPKHPRTPPTRHSTPAHQGEPVTVEQILSKVLSLDPVF